MPPGKAAAQAGHAFLDSFLKADPDVAAAYLADGGTKIVLIAPDEAALCRAQQQAVDLGLPCALVIDSGHVLLPTFTGEPIVTALGIGPAARDVLRPITRGLRLMR